MFTLAKIMSSICLAAFAAITFQSYGQDVDPNLAVRFGKRIERDCVHQFKNQYALPTENCAVFEYKTGHLVQISKTEHGEILEISIFGTDETSTNGISLRTIEEFFSVVDQIKPIGKARVQGNSTLFTMARNSYWDLYESAIVRRFFSFDREAESSYLGRVAILFPFELVGTINRAERFQIGTYDDAYIKRIYIGECSYLALDQSISPGMSGKFQVVGPQNDDGRGCRDNPLE